MIHIGIDPGKNATAVVVVTHNQHWIGAYYGNDPGELKSMLAGLELARVAGLVYRPSSVFVTVEKPQIYQRSPGDSNDLVDVAMAAGSTSALVMEFLRHLSPQLDVVKPHEWKGNVPKGIHNGRVKEALPLVTRGHLVSFLKSYTREQSHNIIDALGLAQYSIRKVK